MSTPGLPAGYALESQPQQQAPATSGLPAGYTVEDQGDEQPRTLGQQVRGPEFINEVRDQFSPENTQNALNLGASVAGGKAAAAAVLPSVLPHTIEGVKAIGAWANKNPIQAWALYNVIKEFIPGAKKVLGLAKSAPTGQ